MSLAMSLAKLWTFGVLLKLGLDVLLPLSRLGVVPAASVSRAALDGFAGALGLVALWVSRILWKRARQAQQQARERLRLAPVRDAPSRRPSRSPSWPPLRPATWQ